MTTSKNYLLKKRLKLSNEIKKNLDFIKGSITKVARKNKNIVESVIDAVENYTTVGEISDCLRNIWGEYNETF